MPQQKATDRKAVMVHCKNATKKKTWEVGWALRTTAIRSITSGYLHTVSGCQVFVNDLPPGQVAHATGNLDGHVHQVLLRNRLEWGRGRQRLSSTFWGDQLQRCHSWHNVHLPQVLTGLGLGQHVCHAVSHHVCVVQLWCTGFGTPKLRTVPMRSPKNLRHLQQSLHLLHWYREHGNLSLPGCKSQKTHQHPGDTRLTIIAFNSSATHGWDVTPVFEGGGGPWIYFQISGKYTSWKLEIPWSHKKNADSKAEDRTFRTGSG